MERLTTPQADMRVSAAFPAHQEETLDSVLVRGLAWTGAVKWLSQLLSWMSIIVVARLLYPEDHEIVAMAGVFSRILRTLD